MADNFPLTPGSGRLAATDQVTYSGDTADVQLMRMVGVTGAEGSKTVVDDPEIKTISRRDLQRISVSSGGLTIATTAYSAGDQVGTLFTLPNAARISGGGGTIVGVSLISAADIIGAYDVLIFDASVALATDNAVYAISDSDALDIVGLVQLAGAYDLGNNRLGQAYNLAIPYVCNGGTSLYASLITRSGHTFFAAVTDLQLVLYVERN